MGGSLILLLTLEPIYVFGGELEYNFLSHFGVELVKSGRDNSAFTHPYNLIHVILIEQFIFHHLYITYSYYDVKM
jgi:hypothetical protein